MGIVQMVRHDLLFGGIDSLPLLPSPAVTIIRILEVNQLEARDTVSRPNDRS